MSYIQSFQKQNWLLPPSIQDMIPKDHICFFVEDFVDCLNYSSFDEKYAGAGAPAYPPRIMMKILIQGMLGKVRSSRKLAGACRENFVFMYLAEKLQPDFHTISSFRKDNASFVKSAFKKTVDLASKKKLVDLSFISIDGSTIKANAAKKSCIDKNKINKINEAIDRMIDEDIAQDELDEQIFGKKEEGLTGLDKRDLKEIVREYRKAKDKNAIKKRIDQAENELEKYDKNKTSITDPESSLLKNKSHAFEVGYNVQLSVSRNQIIIANDVTRSRHDSNEFIPQIKNVKENIKLRKDTKIGLDCGYSGGENIKFAEDNDIDLYVPNRTQVQLIEERGRIPTWEENYAYDPKRDEIIFHGQRYKFSCITTLRKTGRQRIVYCNYKTGKRKEVTVNFKERLRMKKKMDTKEGKHIYSLRKITVEPVYGNIKGNMNFREFLLRGIEKTRTEFNLACIAHNLQKIKNLLKTRKEQTLQKRNQKILAAHC